MQRGLYVEIKAPLVIMSASVLTVDGCFVCQTLTLDEARTLVKGTQFFSVIGHLATSIVISQLLGVAVPMNRVLFQQQVGQLALAFKLHGRLPEDATLRPDDMQRIGYTFKVITRLF